jgi:hypothetical protein
MTHKLLRAVALLPCAAVIPGGLNLRAATVASEKFSVPFSFHVQKQNKILPAGEYKIERTPGSPVTVLENIKTGERIHFLSSNETSHGKAKLVFESDEKGPSLRGVA